MATFWFLVLGFLLVGYAVLDGFDLGVGILHLWVARNNEERRTVLNAIGPVWDGNEVWLITGGATLFMAFPRVYAAGFSGFYLALIIVLWLLMGRGLSLEFRARLSDPLWRTALDVTFWGSNVLLALLYGVAVGNVVNGVPVNAQGYYQGLFAWMLNPYALLIGVLSVVLLAVHGANYLSVKTEGPVQERARLVASRLWLPLIALFVLATAGTFIVRSDMGLNFKTFPPNILVPLAAAALLAAQRIFLQRQEDLRAFLGSAALIAALLGSTAIGLYPFLLPSSPHPERSFTISNSAASSGSLLPATIWVIPPLILIVGYTVFVHRTFKGKVVLEEGGHY
jgi:cytochrome d ubiquinol oxidase subunit II